MPKMMLPATQTSCLKDSHTNLQRYIRIGTRYFGDSLSSYVKKMMLPATNNSCLKYIHTNVSINVGTGTWYIEQLNDLYPKTSTGNTRPIAASDSSVAQTRQYWNPTYVFMYGLYTLFYQSRISKISVLASTRENWIPHFLHTRGTIYCWETGVHISAFSWRNRLGYPAHTRLIFPSVCLSVRLYVHSSVIYKNTEFSCRN
jgi:hypothetical protein